MPHLLQLFCGGHCSHSFAIEFTCIWLSSGLSTSFGARSTRTDSEMFGRWLGSAQNGTGNFGCSGDREFSEHSRALHSRVRGCHALKYPNGPQAAGPQVLCDLCHRPCRRGLCNLCPLSQVVYTIGRPLLVSPEVNFRYFETINNGF